MIREVSWLQPKKNGTIPRNNNLNDCAFLIRKQGGQKRVDNIFQGLKEKCVTWLVWLYWLEHRPITGGLWVWSLVKAPTIPSPGMYRRHSINVSLSHWCSSLPSSLSKLIFKTPQVGIKRKTTTVYPEFYPQRKYQSKLEANKDMSW